MSGPIATIPTSKRTRAGRRLAFAPAVRSAVKRLPPACRRANNNVKKIRREIFAANFLFQTNHQIIHIRIRRTRNYQIIECREKMIRVVVFQKCARVHSQRARA